MSTKQSKKKKMRRFSTRHGVVLIALLALTILVVNLVVYSYSWFTPVAETGKGLEMNRDSALRSERCTFETYQGTLVTEENWESGGYKDEGYFINQVVYNGTKIADNEVITIPKASVATENGESVLKPGRVYFRTNIQNEDTEYPSIVSLYHHEMPANLGVAITYPSNTYHYTEDNYTDYFIVRNAYVKVKDENDVDGPGLLQVEWFVENRDTENTRTIRVTKQTEAGQGEPALSAPIEWLYLMYN
jgi:hypothetical protein